MAGWSCEETSWRGDWGQSVGQAEEPADDPDPIVAEIDEEGDSGSNVEGDNEGQVKRLLGRLGGDRLSQPSHAGTSAEWPRQELG